MLLVQSNMNGIHSTQWPESELHFGMFCKPNLKGLQARSLLKFNVKFKALSHNVIQKKKNSHETWGVNLSLKGLIWRPVPVSAVLSVSRIMVKWLQRSTRLYGQVYRGSLPQKTADKDEKSESLRGKETRKSLFHEVRMSANLAAVFSEHQQFFCTSICNRSPSVRPAKCWWKCWIIAYWYII